MMQFNIHDDVYLHIVCSVSRITSKFVRVITMSVLLIYLLVFISMSTLVILSNVSSVNWV